MPSAPPTRSLAAGLLAIPAEGDRTLESLTRKLRLLALRRLLLVEPSTLPREQRAAWSRLQRAVRELAQGDGSRGLVEAVGRIDVLAPLLAIESGLVEPADWVHRLVPNLILALGRQTPRGAQRETWLWDVPFERLIDADTGRMLWFDPPALGMAFDPGSVEIRCAGGTRIEALEPGSNVDAARVERIGFPILSDGGPSLSIVDTNPLAMLEEHPDKAGNAVNLGDREPDAWVAALREAFDLIAAALPELAAEITVHLQRIVPVGYDAERHLSASYREAPGLIYLSLHPSTLTMAEALIHETQHGKLNTLRWFDAVLDNGDTAWTPSPVRPDLRPLLGVLMAVHAFVPVAALHQRMREIGHPLADGPAFEQRAAQVLHGNAHGLASLRRLAMPTQLGARILRSLDELHTATGGRVVDRPEHEPVARL
jgi:hypothetical protein